MAQPPTNPEPQPSLPLIDIKPLLNRLWPHPQSASPVTPTEISTAISHFFTATVSPVQAASLLMCLHFTSLDRSPEVLSQCAAAMRRAAARIDSSSLQNVSRSRGRQEGNYAGGFCDIVGTGGDSHNTFNISTTASILASSLLLVAKHGNRASTSTSGSADIIAAMQFPQPPLTESVTPEHIAEIYSHTNYAFLSAPNFHPGMKYVAPIRKQLPWRTIFNLLGPLANPMDVYDSPMIEARVIGVARTELGPVFAEALRLAGVKKAMIVCGEEELDEISCAGKTNCWRLSAKTETAGSINSPDTDIEITHFALHPSDFGLSAHPLSTVSGGRGPVENAKILHNILTNKLSPNDPLLEFVLMNTAALFVVSGVCDADSSDLGRGDDGQVIKEVGPGGGRWKEGVRRAKWSIESGEAWKQWQGFVDITNKIGGVTA